MHFCERSRWIALAIGNSRLHWAWFAGDNLTHIWDTPHLTEPAIAQLISHQFNFQACPDLIPEALHPQLSGNWPTPKAAPPLWIASVVPQQTQLWLSYANTQIVTLDQIPIAGLYPTLGIDRALTLWAALRLFGAPALVIDAGTALTYTAANESGELIGGAILPGLQLQLRSLAQNTAALPSLVSQDLQTLPMRWATRTPEAIQSGILYTLLAGMQAFIDSWMQQYPKGAIALTGGDGAFLYQQLKLAYPNLSPQIRVAPHLIFQGIQGIQGIQGLKQQH